MNKKYASLRLSLYSFFALGLWALVSSGIYAQETDAAIEQTFYFTGNTGDAPNASTTGVLEAITTMSQQDANEDNIVDNDFDDLANEINF